MLLGSCRLFRSEASRASEEVLTTLRQQEADWNEGDIDAFFGAYANDGSLRFVSGGEMVRGWQETLDRFKKKYSDREKMGKLKFDIVVVEQLARDLILVVGKWRLTLDGEAPGGMFSLLVKKTPDGWKVFHDHTSLEASD